MAFVRVVVFAIRSDEKEKWTKNGKKPIQKYK